MKDKVSVVDVDGSYLVRKHEQLRQAGVNVAPLGPPSLPLSGWITITINKANCKDKSQKIPRVLPGAPFLSLPPSLPPSLRICACGCMYHVTTILFLQGSSEGVGRSTATEGAFRAFSRGFIHWASGRLEHLEININNPSYCHVRSNMNPSMKQEFYDVYLLLEQTKEDMASIRTATCQCTAGYAGYMYTHHTPLT